MGSHANVFKEWAIICGANLETRGSGWAVFSPTTPSGGTPVSCGDFASVRRNCWEAEGNPRRGVAINPRHWAQNRGFRRSAPPWTKPESSVSQQDSRTDSKCSCARDTPRASSPPCSLLDHPPPHSAILPPRPLCHRLPMSTLPAPASFPFERYRRLRFGGGRPPCPHCGTGRVQRWGSFSGRRRYRCVSCGRTFSDFTGTPLAYLKRIDRWPAFCHCMVQSLSVRRTASLLDLDKHTAFRWRHRILPVVKECDSGPLGLVVAFGETWFPFSEKGKRAPSEQELRKSVGTRHPDPLPIWVQIARDGDGLTVSGVVGPQRPTASSLEAAMASRLLPGSELVSLSGRYGPVARVADRLGASFRRAPTRSAELSAVRDYILALRRWIRRFRGVATRYLENYLTWHRLVEAASRAGDIRAATSWLLRVHRPVRFVTSS